MDLHHSQRQKRWAFQYHHPNGYECVLTTVACEISTFHYYNLKLTDAALWVLVFEKSSQTGTSHRTNKRLKTKCTQQQQWCVNVLALCVQCIHTFVILQMKYLE